MASVVHEINSVSFPFDEHGARTIRIEFPDGGTLSARLAEPPTFAEPSNLISVAGIPTFAFRSPTIIPGAELFAAGVEAKSVPLGVWADWLDERGEMPWFAYALRWMDVRERWPASNDRGERLWYEELPRLAMEFQGARRLSLIPAALFDAMPKPQVTQFSVLCESFTDAVAVLAIGLEKLSDALSMRNI